MIQVHDPANGDLLGEIGSGGPAEADAAVRRARAASEGWRRTAPAERAAALSAAAAALEARADEVAELQTRENGKPLGDSRGGVAAGIGTLREYAALGPLHRGESLAGGWDALDLALREPRGVAVALVPWNDPVAIACGPIGACLVAGNALVLKPSEKTPLSSALMAEILSAHLPDDVLVLAEGDGEMGRALVAHPGVDIVLHTGSVSTGREVAAACGAHLRKAVLELGGKDPLIVDAGVDPAWAAAQAASGAFANAGQVCTSVERIYVHERIAERFLEALVAEARALVPGHGLDPRSTLGPLIDAGQHTVVDAHVQRARADGARLLHGGERLPGAGWFYAPTVLADVPDDTPLMRDETFGPVAAVRAVGDFDEALARAGGGEHGLAATVLTPSQRNALRAVRELPVGTVKVNAVWGGAPGGSAEPCGDSGLGTGYGPHLLDEVTRLKVAHYAPAPWA